MSVRNLFTRICSGGVVSFALLFCVYPAMVVSWLMVDGQLRQEGQSRLVPM